MLADRRRSFELSRTLMLQAANASSEITFVDCAQALGDALSASARRATSGDTRALWREARTAYELGLERARALEARKALLGGRAALPERLRAGIERCDRAMGNTAPQR
jgi:hypothetical protein